MPPRCDNCNREKDWYWDPAYGGFAVYTCPQCDGITGFIRRLAGRINKQPPRRDMRKVYDLCTSQPDSRSY